MAPQKNVSVIAPTEGDFPAPKNIPEQKPAAATKPAQKKKQNSGFGGMQAGFLNGPPPKKKAAPKPKAEQEDLTHLKAKPKGENLKFDEVQEAMNSNMMKNKDEWLTPELFQKLAQKPKLLKAFSDPKAMAALTEFGNNPKEAMQKYGNSPEFRELMQEFSEVMGTHFTGIADKKAAEQKKQEEEIKSDPVYQTI